MRHQGATAEQRRVIREQLRAPVLAFVALMVLLGIVVLLAMLAPSRISSIVEFAILVVMVLIMLLVSMELRDEPPLIRFFSAIGFAWVAVLFALLMVDYLTR